MAEVVTTTLPTPRIILWERPAETDRFTHDPASPAIPFGEAVFSGIQVIPAKINTNTSKWQLTISLPRGYAYLLAECALWVDSTEVVLDDFEKAMRVLITANPGDPNVVFSNGLLLINQMTHFSGTTNKNSVQNNASGAAADFTQFSIPPGAWPRSPIMCEAGDGTWNLSWFDMSADSSALVNANFRIRFLMYTVEQLRTYPIHSPILTYP